MRVGVLSESGGMSIMHQNILAVSPSPPCNRMVPSGVNAIYDRLLASSSGGLERYILPAIVCSG